MAEQLFNLPQFLKYLGFSGVKDDDIHIVSFELEEHGRLKSELVSIDFYIFALKPPIHKDLVYQIPVEDQASSYMFVNSPHSSQSWDIEPPSSGYVICVSEMFMKKIVKDYSFFHYSTALEAIFLMPEEEVLLWDLYKKAYEEFRKTKFNKQILLSYIALILSYTQTFYDRQFQSRSNLYNKVIADFNQNMIAYFSQDKGVTGLPSVAYFAQLSFLSPNYFGDLVKHLSGKSPIEHIHGYVVELAKERLLKTRLSISEISYGLGFDYPNYFARFFRKHTGLSPKSYRDQ
ncbi:AraC family transcriptional regulator [Pedobacter sp. ISL-68]|uniref:helix-turn-helix domain-containing protein n=1 Tax=unclassified Pedobacter TaxID=2628915 RepID=UPI001BEBD3FD|nr:MULTISPECIES: AraC family transcriptional regulator [unclassified Pedobacter]MBT2560708.1 AraC family transcriptional regulator [Pedobacter sp. ISL-64]MBT2590087.1 AraC family transcriptional regulator [Pedobacter sp. ISL-68]